MILVDMKHEYYVLNVFFENHNSTYRELSKRREKAFDKIYLEIYHWPEDPNLISPLSFS